MNVIIEASWVVFILPIFWGKGGVMAGFEGIRLTLFR
jgi:hypothetical protein